MASPAPGGLCGRQDYKDWKQCSEYQFSKTYRHIDRAVAKWIETRKEQMDEQIAGSGVALADTDWKQVLDEWIVFLGDLEAERQKRKEVKTTEEQSAREQAQLENGHKDGSSPPPRGTGRGRR
ncbi:hypothetical protein V8E54_010551 [Elaphomyces granulatus]